MTEKEAIEILLNDYMVASKCIDLEECRKHNQAVDLAIMALQKQIELNELGKGE